VVGSAPGLAVPTKDRFDRVICVNGSGFPARALGIDRPALTVISGFSTRSDSHFRRETHKAWRDLETDHLILVASGRRVRRERRVIEAAGLRFEQFSLLSAEERALIVMEVCKEELARGERDQRISMGAFAAILALWGGASEAILCGFSLSGGHSYLDGDTPRHHVAGDIRFLECARQLSLPLSTTARPLHETFGLALVS
jgi:hypothetical protein